MAEFLPLCDVLFNVISLAGYFCDIVFDMVFCYALLERGRTVYVGVVLLLVSSSLVISQIVSMRWFLHKSKVLRQTSGTSSPMDSIEKKKSSTTTPGTTVRPSPVVCVDDTNKPSKLIQYCIIALHCSQMGVLWRYAKLFVPVDLRHVKHEVRDLCMLRLVHAFCEAAPMLLLQLHVLVTMQPEDYLIQSPEITLKSLGGGHITTAIVQQPSATQQQQLNTFRDLNIVSAVLSLFSVCWALASFSKNVRLQNVHRLVLTWLGVIFQFLWRLGTVISRVASLTVYASLYSYWIFLVIVLHWISMFLWLISPKNVFHGERISRVRKAVLAGLIAIVYIFAYVNLQEVRHRQKMITFYVVMMLENTLLVCLWMVGVWPNRPENWYMVPVLVLGSFVFGMAFMLLYYRYFHVRRLGYEAGGRFPGDITTKYLTGATDGRTIISGDSVAMENAKNPSHAIPGVFNCRFSNPVGNGATKRKKKKPTSFVPPPTLSLASGPNGHHDPGAVVTNIAGSDLGGGPMLIPFWRRPLPRSHTGGSSENEGSAGSRVNIHQKLQEKKQKQLAELKIIEEEIKQGKLGGPVTSTLESDDGRGGSLLRQPIPRAKKHINVEPIEWRPTSPDAVACGTGVVTTKGYNDLNVLSSANLDEVNNLNKYTNNYDPLYNSFGLNSINIPALAKDIAFASLEHPAGRNMSPSISSQVSATESNSLTRCKQVAPRATKMQPHHNLPRNPFAETYRGAYPNVYADGAANNRAPSISPRATTTSSPSRGVNGANCTGSVVVGGVGPSYDHHPGLYLEANHPRQISGTYSSSIENTGADNLPFPYNVIPPPRSKLHSRHTPTAPLLVAAAAANNTAVFAANQHHQQQRLLAAQRQLQRAKTPEILLAPHYLENSRIYYDWVAREPVFRLQDGERHHRVSSGDENLDEHDDGMQENGGHRPPSDIDSQISLPRSYTLPREFKYYRRNKGRKIIKNEHFITSTNSSDGDVDSGDDNESERHSNESSNRTNNNSQRRLRPSPNVRNHFHNHGVPPVTAAPSPQTTIPVVTGSASATASPLSHQQLPYVTGGRIMSPSYMNLGGKPVNSLDLINGVIEVVAAAQAGAATSSAASTAAASNALNRQMRLRAYGNGKGGGMVRHETKL